MEENIKIHYESILENFKEINKEEFLNPNKGNKRLRTYKDHELESLFSKNSNNDKIFDQSICLDEAQEIFESLYKKVIDLVEFYSIEDVEDELKNICDEYNSYNEEIYTLLKKDQIKEIPEQGNVNNDTSFEKQGYSSFMYLKNKNDLEDKAMANSINQKNSSFLKLKKQSDENIKIIKNLDLILNGFKDKSLSEKQDFENIENYSYEKLIKLIKDFVRRHDEEISSSSEKILESILSKIMEFKNKTDFSLYKSIFIKSYIFLNLIKGPIPISALYENIFKEIQTDISFISKELNDLVGEKLIDFDRDLTNEMVYLVK